jgi:hypothetical protein
MPKYRNGLGNSRYFFLLHHLRDRTTSRSRRVIIYFLCLLLFLIAVRLARRSKNTVSIPIDPAPPVSDVYYVSKRALCSQSIAYELLGIQPIAVSKVVLRPVVRHEKTELYDGRLEVLANAMINDVVFLDRNLTGKEAELNANICPMHTVSVLPPRKPMRYTASSIVFGVTLSMDDLPKALQHWRYWARDPNITFHVLLPSSDRDRVSEANEMISNSLGIKAHVESAREMDDPGKLMLMLVQQMLKNGAARKEWLIVLSSDTFVTSLDDILLALEPYSAAQQLYMGGLSESARLREQWGRFAYGGAGVVLSRPVADIVSQNSIYTPRYTTKSIADECLKNDETIHGDGLLAKCISRFSSAEFTILPTFHQCDVEDDISGILQAPFEFATLYNLIPDALSLFPPWHSLGPESSSPAKYSDQIDLFHHARQILSPRNWGIRYRFGEAGRFLLTNGYSITEFLRPPFPSNHDIGNAVEGTFNNGNDDEEFTFHTSHDRGVKELPTRFGLREGDDKRTYYLRAIAYTHTQANTGRGKPHRDDKEVPVFVYTNECANIRRGIEVVWLL